MQAWTSSKWTFFFVVNCLNLGSQTMMDSEFCNFFSLMYNNIAWTTCCLYKWDFPQIDLSAGESLFRLINRPDFTGQYEVMFLKIFGNFVDFLDPFCMLEPVIRWFYRILDSQNRLWYFEFFFTTLGNSGVTKIQEMRSQTFTEIVVRFTKRREMFFKSDISKDFAPILHPFYFW